MLIAEHPCLRWTTASGTAAFVPYQSSQDDAATHAYAIPFLTADACLVTRRGDGRWTLPGGTLRTGETWPAALHREILEETGFTVDEHRPFGAFAVDDGTRRTFRIVCIAAVTQTRAPADPDGEAGIVEVRSVSSGEAAKLFSDFPQYGAVYAIAAALRREGL